VKSKVIINKFPVSLSRGCLYESSIEREYDVIKRIYSETEIYFTIMACPILLRVHKSKSINDYIIFLNSVPNGKL